MLIEVVSFHSYYGKQQIYHVLKRSSAAVSSQLVTQRIRYEIGKLFEACKRDNKLVLTRVMDDAQREFELSVEAIRQEAEESAFEAVRPFLPVDPIPVEMPRKQSLLTRLLGWLGGR